MKGEEPESPFARSINMNELPMAFAVHGNELPAIEVRVNFGVFAGRPATNTEIERLAEWLLDDIGEVSIIAEQRHEMDAQVEASVHLVRIELTTGVPDDPAERLLLEARILERAEHWAHLCVADRRVDVAEI